MTTVKTRKIVKIDPDKCNGCGLCVPSCAEGAIQIIDGKARLLAENLCDGLGNCLGKCPLDAIVIEERPADEFDESAVENHLGKSHAPVAAAHQAAAAHPAAHQGGCPSLAALGGGRGAAAGGHGGCPGSMLRKLQRPAGERPAADVGRSAAPVSRLGQWPVQLALLPVQGEIWRDADVLIAADCVPFAMADFHEALLAGKTLGIACPKLDDVEPYVQKLAAIFAGNTIRSLTVAHMEVPCCTGIVRVVREALRVAGRDIPVRDVTIGVDGRIQRIA
jgi:NAD-dependent dihydropyrimidine dehydrogenase PreA subunit